MNFLTILKHSRTTKMTQTKPLEVLKNKKMIPLNTVTRNILPVVVVTEGP